MAGDEDQLMINVPSEPGGSRTASQRQCNADEDQLTMSPMSLVAPWSLTHRITKSQNGRGWKGPLWVI